MKYIKTLEKYKSDEDIESEYDNFKIKEFKVDRIWTDDGGASGSIVIEFEDPDAEDSDYRYDTKYDNWIKYDSGPKIAFDHWYPEKLNIKLKKFIEKGVKKEKMKLDAEKYNI